MAQVSYSAVGRRKKAVARVRLVPGEGNITINKRDIDNYFGVETLKMTVRQPLTLTQTTGRFDVLVNVYGGGFTGQAGAIRHGIARALIKADEELRPRSQEGWLPHPRSSYEGAQEVRLEGRPSCASVQQALIFCLVYARAADLCLQRGFSFYLA